VNGNPRPVIPDTISGSCGRACRLSSSAPYPDGEVVNRPVLLHQLSDATSSSTPQACPSDTSTLEVLRRPLEFTQYTSIRFTERLAEAGIQPSVGAVGSSYDNALAETINGLYKTELIKPRKPWRTVEEVEYATARWVDWFNHHRLYEYCGDIPPIETEAAHYAQAQRPAAG
jgi:transposase InsO family protein